MVPLVSVIIPVHNRSLLLQRAVHSVLKQTYPNIELIVIDDGSDHKEALATEVFLQTVQSLSLKKNWNLKWERQAKQGVSSARNHAVTLSQGDWLTFLDSDDEWYPSKLEKQMAFHANNPQLFVSQCEEEWIRKERFVNQPQKLQKREGFFFKESLENCLVTVSSVCLKRELWTELGGFREELPACEDYDLWLRIFALGREIGLLKETLLIRYGGHPDQLSMRYKAMDRFRIYSMLHILSTFSHGMKEENLQSLIRTLVRKWEILALGYEKRKAEIPKEAREAFRKIVKDPFAHGSWFGALEQFLLSDTFQ
ncbi:glycosyltransferase-like protein, family 2 [Leptospira ryugenii]|uniref:Glycosyltransferase-like protein, family 2 n=1 Tax=Leptospira ryugenii TaxID=1917863 RepID=A0A2P2DWY6_9LEPT|nr:glycosyltransferase family A protein [Leptospira ryugenii]GBF49090.1 glycosyltransferase-like protein, family 2 [Leptospira ryugenii]